MRDITNSVRSPIDAVRMVLESTVEAGVDVEFWNMMMEAEMLVQMANTPGVTVLAMPGKGNAKGKGDGKGKGEGNGKGKLDDNYEAPPPPAAVFMNDGQHAMMPQPQEPAAAAEMPQAMEPAAAAAETPPLPDLPVPVNFLNSFHTYITKRDACLLYTSPSPRD